MVRATGLKRPDRGTIGASCDHRDYPMSTHGDESPVLIVVLNGSDTGLLGFSGCLTVFHEKTKDLGHAQVGRWWHISITTVTSSGTSVAGHPEVG
jgi:hypothetical protein